MERPPFGGRRCQITVPGAGSYEGIFYGFTQRDGRLLAVIENDRGQIENIDTLSAFITFEDKEI